MVDYRLKTFLTLYETMNYRQTAEKLSMTQPAVTQHIHALETEYGCRLFLYDRRTLTRTEKAEQLALYSRSLLYNESRFKARLRENGPCTLRVGATKTIGEFVIAGLVEEFLRRAENTLSLSVDNTERLLHRLEDGELDFALVEGGFDRQKYACRLFRHEPFMGICSPTHPFAGREAALEDVFHSTVIVREEGSGTRAILEQFLTEQGYSLACFDRRVCISNFTMLRRLVADNLGLSFAYRAVAESESRIATFTVRGLPLVHDFNYVYLKNTGADRLIDEFDPAGRAKE